MLISLLIFAIIMGLIWYLLSLLPLPEPFRLIVTVIFVVICILFLLSYLPGTPMHYNWRY